MSNEVIKKEEKYIEEIKKLVENLKYGSLTLIVQDGKVIQIDKTEKFRL
ncbi:MAG: YezD family protein [Lachnospiraceae bacterium]|nr:YezD family protein [Lachnospiraceae bacterium]MEE1342802.1 YezD family protein [Lachnospiraceae bacterium]